MIKEEKHRNQAIRLNGKIAVELSPKILFPHHKLNRKNFKNFKKKKWKKTL
jgi:hypothetical protein